MLAAAVAVVADGEEISAAAALAAAGDALIAAARRCGRKEYRVNVVDMRMIVVPGLSHKDTVDFDVTLTPYATACDESGTRPDDLLSVHLRCRPAIIA